jgi:predicted RNA-binding Zn-ribbon protein involved in translation (DUF1610 family)
MTMHTTSELRHDGNAVAGLLGEVFTAEATVAVVRCAACGQSGAVGETLVYDQCPGVVVRCAGCTAVLMRFARMRDRMVADLRGIATLGYRADR